jgi:uracil-DNA glycosylase
MRAQLEAVADELRRLRATGVEQVYVSDETLAHLRKTTARRQVEAGPSSEEFSSVEEEIAAPAPERKFTARAASAGMAGGGGLRWDGQPIAPLPAPPVVELPKGSKAEQMAWLRETVLNCPVCREHIRPTGQIVFGVGSPEAEIFFCGEGPGADEERQGEPFVGPAGQLLTRIIQAMGLAREQVYIGNIMKWRPEMPTEWGNREPTLAEVEFSLPYLRAQLAIVQPKVIVALGKTAVNGLLGHDPARKMGTTRGRWHEFAGIPLMPTFHPSYLLRNPAMSAKRQVWEDMLLVMERVGMPVSEKQRGFFQGSK